MYFIWHLFTTQAEIAILVRVVKTTINEQNVKGDLKGKTPMKNFDQNW